MTSQPPNKAMQTDGRFAAAADRQGVSRMKFLFLVALIGTSVGCSQKDDSVCSRALEQRNSWIEAAAECSTADDCQYFGCTCHAIGRGPAANLVLSFDGWLDAHCTPMPVAYCGDTELVCVDGQCATRAEYGGELRRGVGSRPNSLPTPAPMKTVPPPPRKILGIF